MAGKHRAGSGRGAFSRFNCESIEYELNASLDKFKLMELKTHVARISGESPGDVKSIRGGTSTRNPRTADYHIHFRIRWPRQRVIASIEYVKGASYPEPQDKGPFTEGFMAWLGRFFKNDVANCEVGATFSYPSKRSELVLPLPMRLPVGGQEIEVYGMLVGLPPKPRGAYGAFVSFHKDEVTVSIDAERAVDFRHFRLYEDLEALSSVARMFVRGITR